MTYPPICVVQWTWCEEIISVTVDPNLNDKEAEKEAIERVRNYFTKNTLPDGRSREAVFVPKNWHLSVWRTHKDSLKSWNDRLMRIAGDIGDVTYHGPYRYNSI